MKTPRPKLTQVLPPEATFQIVEFDEHAKPFWEVVTRDAMSDDAIYWNCTRGNWQEQDLVKAGARECQDGRGVIAVRRFEHGLPISFSVYAAQYAWGQWQIRKITA